MKKVITTVGTSIFSNNLSGDELGKVEKLKNKSATEEWDNLERRIRPLRAAMWKEVGKKDDLGISAEVQSLIKIQKRLKEDIQIYLIATDTILSRLGAELIKDWFEAHYSDFEVNFSSQPNFDVITGLQVQDLSLYKKEGFPNLINRIRKIANDGAYWDDVVFNLTGGYKGIIPILTTIAQVEGVPCYYIFQEEAETNPDLIEIPPVPLEIKTDLFEKHYLEFQKIDDALSPDSFSEDFKRDVGDLLYEDDGLLLLNEFCQILWEKFLSSQFPYYASDEVFEEISNQPNILRILSTKLWNESIRRGSDVQVKKEHRHVFDDGNNGNRIYFFENEGRVYIYKTFDNDHTGHERYLKTAFNDRIKEEVIQKSELRLIKIKT